MHNKGEDRRRRMEIDDGNASSSTGVKKKVAYFYDAEVGNYHYGQGHPMKVSKFEGFFRSFKYIRSFFNP